MCPSTWAPAAHSPVENWGRPSILSPIAIAITIAITITITRGWQGRCISNHDIIPIGHSTSAFVPRSVPLEYRPSFCSNDNVWRIGTLPGPQANPDFFSDSTMQLFFSEMFEVHYNSNRLGIRLIPNFKPEFTRKLNTITFKFTTVATITITNPIPVPFSNTICRNGWR